PRHLPLRERVAKGELISPTIYTSGPSFNGNSVPAKETAIQMVREQKAAGYDFLKIHPGVRREVFDALAATADQVGIRFAGHVPLDVGLRRALEAKYATIDHLDGYLEALLRDDAPVKAAQSQGFGINLVQYLDESKIPQLAEWTREAGTSMVPTEILLENWMSDEDPEVMARRPEMKYASSQDVAKWVEANKKRTADIPSADRRRFVEIRRKLIKALHAGGVRFLLGSDAPQVWNVPGFSVHRELKTLVASGLTPFQALETGTRNVATFFKTSDLTGTLAAGKRADLVLLEGNPLDDIGNTSRIAGVVLRGRWLSREEAEKRLQTEP
ncbi:MAG: amidohydrolase family protein, partial [Acidimicrobiia bacterium]